jgi:hypothetical protein
MRGIPSGYIALVEQRLLESEIVIFELLSTLYNCNCSGRQHRLSHDERRRFSECSKTQSKSKKADEWTSFPLDTDEQRQAWWMKKHEAIGSCNGTDASQSNSPGMVPMVGMMPDASPMSTGIEEIQQGLGTPFPFNPTLSETTTVSQNAWISRLDSQSEAENSFQSSRTTGVLMVEEEPIYPRMADSVNHTSPETRNSKSDRWRKYF